MEPLLRFFGRPGWDKLQEDIAAIIKDEDGAENGTVLSAFMPEIKRLNIERLI